MQAVGKLPTNRAYNYIDPATTTKIQIVEVLRPEGPITLKRYNPHQGRGQADASLARVSTNMISRVAHAIRPGQPINIERILGGSYNTRSALEALLAHTPEFYVCRPGRIEINSSTTTIKPGHKHLLWCPDAPHEPGIIKERTTEIVISEMPGADAVYEALSLPSGSAQGKGLDIDVARRHAQIQIALVMIGRHLGFRSWVALNDKAIVYNNQKLGEIDGVVPDLAEEVLIQPHAGAIRAAQMVDCIWFRETRFMPAVIEIEHTTGVTSGLARMKNLQDALPPFQTRWIVAAPDEDREKVRFEANKPMFQPLNARYFPYSAVEELYSLCQRRNINQRSVNEEFLDAFTEPCLAETR